MQDEIYMHEALRQAQVAKNCNEVPVGAVLVDTTQKKIIARAHNCPLSTCDPSAHAEMIALRLGAKAIGNYRLPGLSLYVTLEPCTMCAGAIAQARIQRLIFGASDPKGGAIINGIQFFNHPTSQHKLQINHGICAQACSNILKEFFKDRR